MCLSSTNTSHPDKKFPSSGDKTFPRFKRSLLITKLWRKCRASTRLIRSRIKGLDRTVEILCAVRRGRRIVGARHVEQGQPTGPRLGVVLNAVVDGLKAVDIQGRTLPLRSKAVLPRPLLLVQGISGLV